ncbi:Alpha/Beta hydrolase protein [Cercophora scortea]|uniref:Alpha/Beta hydrolase protein n=1 Tax=Cercophora scortea TaxID=314031 RepID=A0AAE0MD35_9PEZI|nr:Alpha/Beta hydrolase protein [Cercophora scortea]
MFDSNPNLIQEPVNRPFARKVPLILMHDGGGTVFSYHCLGDLSRPLYGIYNPCYHSGGTWEGGIPDMARHYVDLIKESVPRGDIIIGGWSLGGLLSVEMAHIMAGDLEHNVIGIVMIDSVYPKIMQNVSGTKIVQHAMQWNEHTRQETRDAVQRCFSEASKMVGQWTLPTWGDGNEAMTNGVTASANGNGHATQPKAPMPPPVMLLRAQEAVPVEGDGTSRVDVSRNDRLLGWGLYRDKFITQIFDIPGHHFSIFTSEDRLKAATEKIKLACYQLESKAVMRARARGL